MNLINFTKLRNAIANGELAQKFGVGFNMADWIGRADQFTQDKGEHHCGTVACIGGTATLMIAAEIFPETTRLDELKDQVYRYPSQLLKISEWLDMSLEEVTQMCYPAQFAGEWEKITLDQAVRAMDQALSNYMLTGYTDFAAAWKGVDDEAGV